MQVLDQRAFVESSINYDSIDSYRHATAPVTLTGKSPAINNGKSPASTNTSHIAAEANPSAKLATQRPQHETQRELKATWYQAVKSEKPAHDPNNPFAVVLTKQSKEMVRHSIHPGSCLV